MQMQKLTIRLRNNVVPECELSCDVQLCQPSIHSLASSQNESPSQAMCNLDHFCQSPPSHDGIAVGGRYFMLSLTWTKMSIHRMKNCVGMLIRRYGTFFRAVGLMCQYWRDKRRKLCEESGACLLFFVSHSSTPAPPFLPHIRARTYTCTPTHTSEFSLSLSLSLLFSSLLASLV